MSKSFYQIYYKIIDSASRNVGNYETKEGAFLGLQEFMELTNKEWKKKNETKWVAKDRQGYDIVLSIQKERMNGISKHGNAIL